MGNTETVYVACGDCHGSGSKGKDSHGNAICCGTCGGWGQVPKEVHRR